ncbi:MAG TPA: peptide chain release factor N(5)-glutamine methyltransferase [Candidatus Methylomirabilis sp.]
MLLRELLAEERDVPRTDLLAIASHVLSLTKERLLAEPVLAVDEASRASIRRLVAQRRRGRPLAYITGTREFFSEEFLVDERVLVPRPETEIIVEEALALLEGRPGAAILDVGCGSGAIGIVLALKTGARVVSIDMSVDALAVARRNMERLGVRERVDLLCGDLAGAIKEDRRFDLIVANLPYVPDATWQQLMPDVRDFEPKLALVGGEDGLDLYRRLVPESARLLRPGGFLLCEVDGREQAQKLEMVCRKASFSLVRLKKDYGGRERVVAASWTSS